MRAGLTTEPRRAQRKRETYVRESLQPPAPPPPLPSLRAAILLLPLKAPARWTPPTVIRGPTLSAARQSRRAEFNGRGPRDCVDGVVRDSDVRTPSSRDCRVAALLAMPGTRRELW